jgi:hypothetical protein
LCIINIICQHFLCVFPISTNPNNTSSNLPRHRVYQSNPTTRERHSPAAVSHCSQWGWRAQLTGSTSRKIFDCTGTTISSTPNCCVKLLAVYKRGVSEWGRLRDWNEEEMTLVTFFFSFFHFINFTVSLLTNLFWYNKSHRSQGGIVATPAPSLLRSSLHASWGVFLNLSFLSYIN